MLAPFRGRRRNRDRRSRPNRAARSSSRPARPGPRSRRSWPGGDRRGCPSRPRRGCAPPVIRRSSPSTSIRAPSARRPAAIPAIRSDSLWRSSPAPRMTVVPRGGRRGEAQDRDLVDRGRHVGRPELDRAKRRGTDDEVGDRFAHAVIVGSAAGRSSMSAPIDRRMSITARRVGLTPTSCRTSSASGWMAPATSQNAAAETSPGTRSVTACTDIPPSTVQATAPSARSVRSTGTPRARSIRSVWSRVATDSRTVVRPSARNPASRIADFT